ncbi:hypothetical protein [Sulfurimonas marina]|uniref:AbiV family abortive infection protein n=1 Tax=Sulfurimonas marina TaxID=2590551 RepID=A0A7M1AVA0_9BACT|nr:hypothetical protein [Sulfurimonas marina]QOP41359.1 hypothetical protein FJR03_06225 [Sulfurimonas marina]
MSQAEAVEIYLNNMRDVKKRIEYAENQLSVFNTTHDYLLLENALLHTRKALECIAYASIAPNKNAYSKFRSEAKIPADFRKDYHGGKILKQLERVNKDFYPLPLVKPKLVAERQWHFDRLSSGYLTKKQYSNLYDRLGKFLHSDNPWDNDKGYLNLANDMPENFQRIKSLLQIHATFVQDNKSRYAFVVDMGSKEKDVSVITAIAGGPFNVDI